ncbi:ABC transporter substrate-binding protein [Cutibacterium acnes]|uniref:ABC transporter substrate-binding protein n=1 Tax=Cutibacterium granulosum TaxID=33011 RepID=UPI00067C62B3|nr:ABC transporter substrate-binding protein [Cutibacterium granulosum]KPG64941.1 ABC transporter substrate-binding protein [Cutibacterium acnes]KPG67536.1 ABC transporter substrate-binding protein [Cutibacterium acnes]WGH36348.1 ABC transporter substrate-binding protein [Cutibacterium acnes]WGH38511.1 ABC transporter substrate-binding protein [Cutibacterium acnes]
MTTPMGPGNEFDRRGFMRLTGAIAMAAGLTVSLSACGGDNPNKKTSQGGSTSSGGVGNSDGTITAGISYELGTNGYDPMTTTAALTVAANWHTLEGLYEIEPTDPTKAYAALAADEKPRKIDEKTYEVKLREKAAFSDGSKVTADDVVFSYDRVMDPKNNSLYSQFTDFVIDSITKKDESTVVIKLKFPFEELLANRLATFKVVPKVIVEKDQKKFDANPVGTGPWKMTANGSGGSLKFARNEHYNGPRPAKAAKMVWNIMPDPDARTNALTSGSVQAIDSLPYTKIPNMKSSGFEYSSEQGFGLAFAMFNCSAGNPFNNVKNRQAVMYAMDVAKACKVGLSGQATPATCFVQAGHPAYQKAKVVYDRDLDKAKTLFRETGLKKFRVLGTDHDWMKAVENILVDSLKEADVVVEFDQKQSADVYNEITGKPEAYDVVLAPGDPSVFGADADLLMRWWYAGEVWVDGRMHRKGQPAQKQFDGILEKAAQAKGDEQMKGWHECFDLLSENVPLYPLFHRKTPTAWDGKSLVGFKPISLTGLDFLDVASTK